MLTFGPFLSRRHLSGMAALRAYNPCLSLTAQGVEGSGTTIGLAGTRPEYVHEPRP